LGLDVGLGLLMHLRLGLLGSHHFNSSWSSSTSHSRGMELPRWGGKG